MKKRQLPRSIKRLPKYGDGIDLFTKNKAGNMEFGSDIGGNVGVSAGLSTAGTLLSMMPDKTVRDSQGNLIGTRPSAGESIGSEALKYAGMGAAFGPYGAAAGALVGGTIGLINSNKQKQELEKARAETEGRRMIDEEAMGSKYQDFLSSDYQTNTKSFYAFGGYSDFANYPTTSLPLMVPPSQAKKRSLKHFQEGGTKPPQLKLPGIQTMPQSSTAVGPVVRNVLMDELVTAKTPEAKKAAEAKMAKKRVAKNPETWTMEDWKQYRVPEPGIQYVPVESALLPSSLPLKATSKLGKAAVFGAEVLNPVAGVRMIQKPTSVGFSSVKPTINTAKNLEDLNAAQKFAQQYGYELPQNLERIAQSDELTNRTIRGLMDRHNTFVRGVSTNWDELGKRNPEILRHLEGKGFDLSTKEGTKAAAEYMATHIPINTGYGRASLNNEVFDRGMDGLYTSNSIPTAEGYTYGQGYITKVKKPTNYSSSNRQDWITQNNPEYYEHNLPGGNTLMIDGKIHHPINMDLPYLYNVKDYDNINVFKNEILKDLEKNASDLKTQFERTATSNPEYSRNMRISYDKVIKQIEDIKAQKWETANVNFDKKLLKTEHQSQSFGTDFGGFGNTAEDVTTKLSSSIQDQVKHSENLMKLTKQVGAKNNKKIAELTEEYADLLAKGENELTSLEKIKLESLEKEILDLKWDSKNEVTRLHTEYLDNNFPGWQNQKDKYAHYIHLGTPGEKVLQPIKSWEITPEIWKNKSRAHSNKYTKKLSALEEGGVVEYPNGGKVNTLEGDLISKVIMNRNRDKNFVQRAYALGQNPGMFTLQDPENFGDVMSHKMAWGEDETGQAYMYPTIMNPNNEAIKVPNQYADYISSEGYKKATGMKYAYGGIKRSISQFVNGGYGEPNSEIEDNELVQIPGEYPMAMDGGQLEMANSNMFEADGQTHEEMNSNGTTGIETYLPQGSRVFSDRVKHNGRTIASIVSPISKKIGKLEERMEKMPSKALENTINLLKNQEDFYFNKQEEIKQDKEAARTLRTFMKGGYKYC